MNLTIPKDRETWLFGPYPSGVEVFTWQFSHRPPCEVGEQITFMIDDEPLGIARVSEILKPGETFEFTGRSTCWSVCWNLDTLDDLRTPIDVGFCCNNRHGLMQKTSDYCSIFATDELDDRITFETPGLRVRDAGDHLCVGRRKYPHKGRADYVGNIAWNQWRVLPLVAVALVNHLAFDRRFEAGGAAPDWVYTKMFIGEPFTIFDLMPFKEVANAH